MRGLAMEFLTYSKQWSIEPELVNDIMDTQLDVENLIEEIDRICEAGTSLPKIGRELDDLTRAEKVRTEVEWFVQHAAERVTPRDAQLMWGSVLRSTVNMAITFVTTNYDRAIELAANGEGVVLEDGFAPPGDEKASWSGFQQNVAGSRLIKIHGSTDWFTDTITDDPIKIRHPMALFGRATLRLEGLDLGSALVLPSRDKLLNKAPYPRLSQAFLNAADESNMAFVVGSSLRDNHIRSATKVLAENVPVFLVNTSGDNQGVEDGYVITEHASTFLMSTLPNALASTNPAEYLIDRSRTTKPLGTGILPIVKEILDQNIDIQRRCDAIESLHMSKVTLPPNLVERALNYDDATVARYALGLIPYSTLRHDLIEIARNSTHSRDAAFLDELAILDHIVRPANKGEVPVVRPSRTSKDESASAGELESAVRE